MARRKPGFRIIRSWSWRSMTFGWDGPYRGYTGDWINFYIYIGPLEFNFEWVRSTSDDRPDHVGQL